MQQLKSAIKLFLKNNGLEKGVKQQNAISIWEEIVGKKIALNTDAESVEHGTLTVKTSSSTWRQELMFNKRDIIEKINKKLGHNIIKDIRFI